MCFITEQKHRIRLFSRWQKPIVAYKAMECLTYDSGKADGRWKSLCKRHSIAYDQGKWYKALPDPYYSFLHFGHWRKAGFYAFEKLEDARAFVEGMCCTGCTNNAIVKVELKGILATGYQETGIIYSMEQQGEAYRAKYQRIVEFVEFVEWVK